MMSSVQASVSQQGPDAAKLGEEIEKAISEALQEAQVGQEAAQTARAEARRAIAEVREALQARGQGVTFTQMPPAEMMPPQLVDVTIAFFTMVAFIVVGLPLARAFARRMDRKGQVAPAAEMNPRLERIEHAVDAIAIEIERISENQRYASRVMQEMRGLPQGGQDVWPGERRVGEPVSRQGQRP